jgi:hypothetical protein
MTDINDSKILKLKSSLEAMNDRVSARSPTRAVSLFTFNDPAEPHMESIGIEFSGNLSFKDLCALSFALQEYIRKEYEG